MNATKPYLPASVVRTLRESLERIRSDIKRELHAYPRPITACDAQYNHLAEKRRNVAGELAALDLLTREHGMDASLTKRIEDFVRSSDVLDRGQKRQLLIELDTPSANAQH